MIQLASAISLNKRGLKLSLFSIFIRGLSSRVCYPVLSNSAKKPPVTSGPESVKGEGTAAELVRVIRKIAQVKKRLRAIKNEIAQLRKSDLYKLKTEAEKAEDEGRDLLAELASQVDQKIPLSRERLAAVIRRSGHT